MGAFFKWGLILGCALVLVFAGFLWLLSHSSVSEPEVQLASEPASRSPAQTVDTVVSASESTVSRDQPVSQAAPDPVDDLVNGEQPEQISAPDVIQTEPPEEVAIAGADTDDVTAAPPASEPRVAEAPTDEPDKPERPEPEGTSYLSGRVLDGAGRALTGVTVLAQYRSESSGSSAVLRIRSDDEGRYRFEDIAAGDYSVSNAPVAGFGEDIKYVRSGSESVNLKLERLRRIRIAGVVRDLQNRAVAGVEINTAGTTSVVRTGDNGAFSVSVDIQADHSTSLRFTRKGFVERIEAINAREVDSSNQINLTVTLNPEGTLSYSGRIIDDYGDPVVGELVRLYSTGTSQAQRATTDEVGEYRITGVSRSDDWYLTIIPKQAYERHEAGPFKVDADVTANDIVLKRTGTARISGTMVDGLGSPVGNLSLVLSPAAAPGSIRTLVADDSGRFQVDEIAAGDLRVSTQSRPHMDISGIKLAPDDDINVTLVVDHGPHMLSGTVIDANRQPVARAELLLTWSESSDGLTSSSFRDTISDASGFFSFTELGQGPHQLSALHEKHPQVELTIDVGSDAEVIEVQMK